MLSGRFFSGCRSCRRIPTFSSFHSLTRRTGEDVVIVSAVRTPVGSMKGSLSSLTAPQLGQHVVRAALARSSVQPTEVDAVYFGSALQAGVGQDMARQCAILAGLPDATPTCTVNKVCSSGMKAIAIAAESIACENATVIVAGGAESMSNAPLLLKRNESVSSEKLRDAVLVDGLNDAFFDCHAGVCGENVASKFKVSREQQDDYTVSSYRRALAAQKAGVFWKEVEPVTINSAEGKQSFVVNDDEEVGRVRFEKIKMLLPVFDRSNGTITAANASKKTDGAAACVLMSARAAKERGVKPLARIVTFAEAGCAPMDFPVAPLYAIRKALEKSKLRADEIARWEINEAFACAVLTITALLNLDMAKVNVNGGGISLGHPLGMSGARIVNHLAHNLQAGELGCAAICNGGGGGTAMILEKL